MTCNICFERCATWKNKAGMAITAMSTCQADKSWSTPTVFPPGELSIPPKLNKPDEPDMVCEAACMPLKLTYNPNEEQGAGFYCNDPLDWENLPVKVETSNMCHLFCDRMLVAVVECREGMWTGNPGLGLWCHHEKEGVGHIAATTTTTTTTTSTSTTTTGEVF